MVNAAEKLVSRARQGAFLEVLPELVELAGRRGGHRNPVWEATAAAIQIMFWQDRFAEAADLAAALIAADGPRGGELCDQSVPFRSAFLAAELHAGVPAGPRLLAASEQVPEGRVLGTDLRWTAEQRATRPIEDLLPNPGDWGGPVRPAASPTAAALLTRDPGSLTDRERRRLWDALAAGNDFAAADRLARSSGETPPQFAVCTWMAGWYATTGETEAGERMLIAAHGRWWPFAKWDALPDPPVLQPTLRPVVTDRVREHYLTRPIGPEARSDRT
ncbi:hypothetical protein [Kitasatospora sp. NPDC088346]|uniref:hypothetical protein n=1 Tax=Kitasatospora sp. NPDC088346 TaxID=3364073 RepID=UPI00381EE3E1